MSRSLPALGQRGQGWVLLQAVLLAAVGLAALTGPGWSGGTRVAAYLCGGALLALGLALIAAGTASLGRALTPLPAPKRGVDVVRAGAYRLVRHPIYGGTVLAAFGWTIVFASLAGLAVAVVLAAFLDLKSRREEQWLVAALPGYEDYRRATPRRLVPFVY